jgi:outer membrane immunogenic protein
MKRTVFIWSYTMKKFLLGTVGVVVLGIAAPASAADLAARPYTKAPPPMIAAIYDWSGFYIGANGGWGTSRDNRTNDTLGLGSYDAGGGVAGGQLGYRWQAGSWVFGLEAQGDWADLDGNTQNLGNPLNHLHSRMDAFGLFTGQVGYAWNNALFYVKGGAAVTDRKFDFVSNATGIIGATSGFSTRWGGTAGVGLEYGFAPNWSAAIEYDHIFESRHNVSFITAAGVPLAAIYSSGGDTDLVTVRVNYRWGGPVIAKY